MEGKKKELEETVILREHPPTMPNIRTIQLFIGFAVRPTAARNPYDLQ